MTGPFDNYFATQSDVGKFLSTSNLFSYHMATGNPALLGLDNQRYLVFPLDSPAELYVGKISDQSYVHLTSTDFDTALTSLSLATSGTITPIWVIPCPNTEFFFWIGVNNAGSFTPSDQQVVVLRWKIDGTGTAVLDAGRWYTVNGLTSRPYHGVGGGGPLGVIKIGGNCFTCNYISTGFPGLGMYNAAAVIKLSTSFTTATGNSGAWNDLLCELPDGWAPGLSTGVGSLFNRVTLFDKAGDGTIVGALTYIRDAEGGPTVKYIPVTIGSMTAGASQDITSNFTAALSSAGLNFAGGTGDAWDDFGSPNAVGSTLIWLRGFSDNYNYARAYQYDFNFGYLSGPSDFQAITQTLDVSCINQIQVGNYDTNVLVLTMDTGRFIYLATLTGPGGGGGGVDLPAVTYSVPLFVGFSYTSRAQLLRPDFGNDAGAANGPAFAKIRRIDQFGASVYRTRSISFGTNFDHLRAYQHKTEGGATVAAPGLKSGTIASALEDGYSYDGQICWEQTRPYPGLITAIAGFISTQDK